MPVNIINIIDIELKKDRLVVYCQLEDPNEAIVSSCVLKKFYLMHPSLKQHFCTSYKHETSVFHLFEHLIINEEVKITDVNNFVFVGTTEWLNRSTGTARIELNFLNFKESMNAIVSARKILKSILS